MPCCARGLPLWNLSFFPASTLRWPKARQAVERLRVSLLQPCGWWEPQQSNLHKWLSKLMMMMKMMMKMMMMMMKMMMKMMMMMMMMMDDDDDDGWWWWCSIILLGTLFHWGPQATLHPLGNIFSSGGTSVNHPRQSSLPCTSSDRRAGSGRRT